MSRKTDKRQRAGSLTHTDLSSDMMGDNSLQGKDQESVRNQREAAPDVRKESDGVVESFRKLDKDVRAKSDLGKERPRKQQ